MKKSFQDIATTASKVGGGLLHPAVSQHPDIVQAIINHANVNEIMPTNNFLEKNVWQFFRDDISRDDFRVICNRLRECWTLCSDDEPKADGVELDCLPDGEVLIRFVDGVGNLVNEQLVTQDAFRELSVLIPLAEVTLRKGPAVAREVMDVLNQGERS